MNEYILTAPCHFGLESVLKREIKSLGYEITGVCDGRVNFKGGPEAVARANVFLRTAERVMIVAGEFEALSFPELFDKTKSIPWSDFIPKHGRFWVKKAGSVKSELFSTRDIQTIVKKAMVDSMSTKYGIEHFPEDGEDYPVRVFINKNAVTIGLDTTGESLHKRGYRILHGEAPIAENLAAALIMLTPWKSDRPLIDPFCGSGTFLTEAALMAANIAPGAGRSFTAKAWNNLIDKKIWEEAYKEAESGVKEKADCDLQGYDLDPKVLRLARENAEKAGVSGMIHFQERPASEMSHSGKYGFIITNPPYGERMEEKAALPGIYKDLGEAFKKLSTWSLYVITSYDEAEKYIGRRADRNRKVYNGMIQTRYYSFEGPKPPKKRSEEGGGGYR